MADGRDEAPAFSFRKTFLWTEIFRCFQVALDPRKLLVAAAGILAMSLGWYLLSAVFYSKKPVDNQEEYQTQAKRSLGEKKVDASGKEVPVLPEDYNAEAKRLYERELAEWRTLDDLAGPGGRLRSMPWSEYRGPNPYLLVASVFSGNAAERSNSLADFLSGTVPVLIEPLIKMSLPIVKFVDANASPMTRLYLLLCLAWSLAVWAFFGGIITRIAAVQLTGKDRVTLQEAVKFVVDRYASYILSPVVPIGIIAVIVIGLALYGTIALIPFVGDIVLYGILMPLVLVGGLVMAILVVGLVGYPMMYTTLSTEGSDTFDSLSRSYNYVFQAPWAYLWYSVVSIVYGAAVTLFVVFLASLTVYLAKWSISQALWSESSGRKPDYLFIYAPESFGWRELFLKGSPLEQTATREVNKETGRLQMTYDFKDPEAAKVYRQKLWGIEKAGAAMVSFWLTLAFLLMLGFSYSYFWSASTMIYLLMRKKVDETELDEIFLEEDLPEPLPAPIVPPKTDLPGATALPTVTAPEPTPAPAPAPVPPPAPTTPAAESKIVEEVKPTDPPKKD